MLFDCSVTKERSQCIRKVAVSAAFENRLMGGAQNDHGDGNGGIHSPRTILTSSGDLPSIYNSAPAASESISRPSLDCDRFGSWIRQSLSTTAIYRETDISHLLNLFQVVLEGIGNRCHPEFAKLFAKLGIALLLLVCDRV